jgi:hypothetical protein
VLQSGRVSALKRLLTFLCVLTVSLAAHAQVTVNPGGVTYQPGASACVSMVADTICANASGSIAGPTAVTLGSGLSFVGGALTASGGSGTVTTTGSPTSGQLTEFSGANSITGGALSGDCTLSAFAITCLETNGTAFGSWATSADTTTGTGSVVALATSPSFTTPSLGAATATSINGNAVPTAGDTVSLLAATQTLTNKSIAGSEINSGTVGATYGGTGVNNGSSTVTLGASLTTTGSGAPTLAFGSTANTYTYPGFASTLAASANVQTFTSSGTGTWTKPGGSPKTTRVIACGGGGGGGSGADLAATTAGSGGGAGGGADCWEAFFATASLGSTETVTVGAGGSGGTAVSSTGAGNPGGAGGVSSFGTTAYFNAYGGGGGQGGASAANTGGGGAGSPWGVGSVGSGGTGGSGNSINGGSGTNGGGGPYMGTGGGGAGDTSGAAGSQGGVSVCCGSGGGSGGGVSSSTTAFAGGAGGASATSGFAGVLGGSTCTVGSSATLLNSAIYAAGPGGAGGGGCTSGTAGSGGNGINGGGGGGGGCGDQHTSGAGGNGGTGFVVVITYY